MLFHSYALSPVVTPRYTKLMLERSTSSKMFVGIPPTFYENATMEYSYDRRNLPKGKSIYVKS